MKEANTHSTSTASESLKNDRDQLVADLEKLLADAKSLGADASSSSHSYFTEKAKTVRTQLNDIIDDVKEHGDATKEQVTESIDKAETAIKERPWRAVGIAVLAGIVIDRILRD